MLDREQVGEFRRQLQVELTAIGEKLGWTIEIDRCSWGQDVTIKLECAPNIDGKVVDKHERAFKAMAQRWFLEAEDFGRTFHLRGKSYEICGLVPNARNYPILAKRVNDGTVYKFRAADVATALGRPVPAWAQADIKH